MPATLYLRPSPRAFFLLTDTHALIFRQPDSSESKASRSVVVAEFVPIDEVDMRGLVRASKGRTVEGVLGVTSVPSERSPIPEIFLLLVSTATPLSPLLPSSPFRPARVLSVEFHSLSSSFWDPPDLALPPSTFGYDDDDGFEDFGQANFRGAGPSSTQSQASAQGVEHPCNGMRKYLESGGFFYAEACKWDISSRMGETNSLRSDSGHPLETFDERFVWNSSLLSPFLAFRGGLSPEIRKSLDEQSLLIPVIQGFCGSLPLSTPTGSTSWSDNRPEVAALGLISRLSWKRAGARFRTRGIDDDGQVANFVETELILATENVCLSYVQVRGSVPLFWQQPSQGIQTLQQKVEITRPAQATQPAFDKHFLELLSHYHSVHAVNLLGQKDAESMLSAAYSEHLGALKSTLDSMPVEEKKGIDAVPEGTLSLTPYDFHAAVRTSGQEAVRYDFGTRLREVVNSMDHFGWTVVDSGTGQIIEQQQGVFRVNCLDCLDRTNYVQDVISSLTLSRFLGSISSPLINSPTLWAAHRELWADNGDRLSKIYAGTGAINTSATRSGKKTFAGLISDATKSVGRAYINNFQDKGKQAAIDMLLASRLASLGGMMAGQRTVILFDPISDSVQCALQARTSEFSKARNVTIFSGTWNLNGEPPEEALDAWLFPPDTPEPDIYAVAFQEIVELTAQQIIQVDPAKRRMWEQYIMDTFALRKGKQSEYILFRSAQLVGTALILVIKSDMVKHIRSVESAIKKTGLQGLSGNKGGVGIRLELFDSTVCFMTCHLAAGHSNVSERNADYRTISQGLRFLRGKMIEDHEIIIWAADFNYRIALSNADVREYAEAGELDSLLAADQLLQAMDEGEVFNGYDEGPITFRPTYKYDNGTDDYDTSEKARIPAWTDRILFKGPLRLKEYDRAELRISDHRPVYAVFEATVREVDQARKEAIESDLEGTLRKSVGHDVADKAANGGLDDLVGQMMNASLKLGVKTKSPVPPQIVRPYAARSKVDPVGVGLGGEAARGIDGTRAAESSAAPRPPSGVKPYAVRPSPRLPPRPQLSNGDKIPANLPPPILPSRSPAPGPGPASAASPRLSTSPVERKSVAAAISAFEGRSTPTSSTATSAPSSGPSFSISSTFARTTTTPWNVVSPASASAVKPAPPIPARAEAKTISSTSLRDAPRIPLRKRSSTLSVAGANGTGGTGGTGRIGSGESSVHETLTPSSTGDFVVVKRVSPGAPPAPTPVSASTVAQTQAADQNGVTTISANGAGAGSKDNKPPPPLPPRAPPKRGGTLDMNGSPPEDLVKPVSPDVVKSQSHSASATAGVSVVESSSSSSNSNLSSPTKKVPPAVKAKPVNLRSVSSSSGGGH